MLEILDYTSQAIITFTGFTSLYLMASQDPRMRYYAGLVGLFGEPFWFFTAWVNAQYGVMMLVLVYGVNWARLAYFNWKEIPRGE
jgi:nicotinamide riboside transporter PnuC